MKEKPEIKELPKKLIIFFVAVVALFAVGSIGFMLLKHLSFSDSLMRTLETLAFMFEDDTGTARILEVFLALFGVMIVWWIFWSLFDIILAGNLTEYLKTRSFLSSIRKMKNHYIVAGGGRVGEELALELAKKKKSYIIIEKEEDKVEKLKQKGFNIIQGDVTEADNSDLIRVGIKQAKTIILAMPETEKNLLMTMTAKELNPKIEVLARADNPAFVSKLRKAGAKTVIVPEIAAADEFMKQIK